MTTSFQVTFDALDPASLSDFWAAALGYVVPPPPPEFESWDDWATAMEIPPENWNDARALVDPDGVGPRIFIQRVPEAKASKNRLHLDLNISGGPSEPSETRRARVDAEVERLATAGAAVVGPVEERGGYWVVLQDPEGNEFCVH